LKKFVGGETHLYLGRQYRMKIISNKIESVKLKNGFIVVTAQIKSRVAELIKYWYLEKARTIFHTIAQPLIEKFKRLRVKPASISLRIMRARWGSCTPSGKIILNPDLIRAPRACIAYVITHELCHLKYHDHSRKFSDLLTHEMPDWQKWKDKLEKLLA
jgi:predicted metal-dependent hydrolase